MLTSAELAEVANLVMSLELANLSYYFIHPIEGNYFYVFMLKHWIVIEGDFILAIG